MRDTFSFVLFEKALSWFDFAMLSEDRAFPIYDGFTNIISFDLLTYLLVLLNVQMLEEGGMSDCFPSVSISRVFSGIEKRDATRTRTQFQTYEITRTL